MREILYKNKHSMREILSKKCIFLVQILHKYAFF